MEEEEEDCLAERIRKRKADEWKKRKVDPRPNMKKKEKENGNEK